MSATTSLVVVSFYDRRSTAHLEQLLASLARCPAGGAYDLVVVANRTSDTPLSLPGGVRVLERENLGMNIGAWDHGWRSCRGYEDYLFLQDECFAVREGWLTAFQTSAAEAALVGESLNPAWDKPWQELRAAHAGTQLPDHTIEGKPAPRVDVYLDYMARLGIDPGPSGRHLRSLIWFAKRETLEAIDGFPIGASYGECIAAEIAVSRKVEALGLKIAQVAPQEPFRYFRHLEFNRDHPAAPYSHKRVTTIAPASARAKADAEAATLSPSSAEGRVVFRVHSSSPLLASTRYRALMPALGLETRGIPTLVTDKTLNADALASCRAIVFAKAFRPADMALAFEAHQAGAPIVLDICDDMFIPEYGGGKGALYAATFKAMAQLASAIVTTGPRLRDTVAALTPETPITIIPDQLETPELLARLLKRPETIQRPPSWRARAAFAWRDPKAAFNRVRARLAPLVRQAPPASAAVAPSPIAATSAERWRTIIWFGNHGADHSAFGMAGLADVLPYLAECAKTHKIRLLVVSNSREKFAQMFGNVPFRTEYREWSPTRIFADLDEAEICLIPLPKERFAMAKSANRVALALSRGAAVIADDFPALDEFSACVIGGGDWKQGLATYLEDEARRQADIERGRAVIERLCSAERVARLWADLISSVTARR